MYRVTQNKHTLGFFNPSNPLKLLKNGPLQFIVLNFRMGPILPFVELCRIFENLSVNANQ